MKKQIIRFFSLLMLVVLLVTVFAMQVNARVVFSDLAPTHWCYNKIIDFESKGYVCGYEDGTFRADQTITRAEYVKMVNNFFGYKPNTEKVANFSDVNSGDWFAPYVNEAVERGYITGFEDGTFRPQDPIRRQEATVILSRILGIDKEVYPANHIDGLAQYSDSDEVQDWARVAIHSYSVYNFINGYTDGTLKILQNVTRAETVELLNVLEQKIVIDRKPGGGSKSTVKMPTIALYRLDKEANEFASIQASDLKSGWVNKAISTLSGDVNGVLVNITSTTSGATINEKLTGNKTGERKYITSKIEELTNAIFLTDGEYKISAFASKTGYHSSSSADKTILVDTKAPVVSGEVVTTLPEGTAIAHVQQVKVSVADLQTSGVNKISGLDTAKVRYAWFVLSGDDDKYVRETDWKNVNLDNAVITTEGLKYGTYKLAISAYDIAENAYGDKIDTVVTTSGDEEFREEIPYDFVEEVEKEGEEKPEDPDIVVIVGNNPPDVKNLIMKTQVGVEVSGDIDATDKDGDTLSYALVNNSGDSQYASISGDTTTFKHDTAGTYYYNVEVSDDKATATALVTVYVYDVSVVTPSGDKEEPINYDVLTNDLILYVGEERNVTASVLPDENASFEWNEDSREIDIVNDSQNNATVTIEGKVLGNTQMTVKVIVDGVEITKTINVTVRGRKLTIHYVYKNGENVSGDHVIEEVGEKGYSVPSPVIEGFTPDKEKVEGEMPKEDTEITVTYKANSYKLTYKVDGNMYEEETYEYGATITPKGDPTKEGYTFSGWSEIPETMPAEDIEVTGTFTINSYKLTYKVDGNVYGEEETYEYGATITPREEPTKKGYTFSGWSEIPETMPAEDVEVTGTFTINSYKLTYKVDGNVYGEAETYEYGATIKPKGDPTKEGYTFSGWSEVPETMPARDIEVTGTFTINSYKLTYKVDGNVYGEEETYKYGAKITPRKAPTKEGYTFSGWSGVPETMPARDVEVTGTFNVIKAPKLDIKTFVKKNKDDSKEIDKLIYKEDGDNTYWYVIKVENTIENSYPKAVASAVITDELPSYLEFVSGEATSGTISSGDSGNKTCTITWNAENIGYDNDAQYAYIKVRVKKSAFKDYEETTETKNMISNIKVGMKNDNNLKDLPKNNTDTTAFFVRYANPVDAGVGSGYLYAGAAKTQISNIDFNRGSNYVFITKSGTNTQYTDEEINKILGSKDEERISKMLEDFVKGQANIKKYIKNLNDCSDEKIRDNVSNLYDGNVTISGTQVILWYKFIKTGENESKKAGTKTYTITSTDDNNKESTVSCVVDYPANAYHLDGLVVDIKTLTTIPAGKPIDISNTAEIKDTGANHMSTIKLYYESDKEDIEDVTALELDIGEGDPVMNNEILESVSDVNKEEVNQDLENNNSGDIAEIKDDENISSGDIKTEESDERQQEEPKAEENSEEQQEEPKAEENSEEQQEEPKAEENGEEQQEEPKTEENSEEQQEEPKAEENSEEQQEEPKAEENGEEQQEEPKAEENSEEQQEEPKLEEKRDEIIALEPQAPSNESQETSSNKDDEKE